MLHQRRYRDCDKHIKRGSTATVIWKRQSKTRYHCTFTRIALKRKNWKYWALMWMWSKLSYFVYGNANGITTLKNILAISNKVKYILIIGSSNPTPRYLHKWNENFTQNPLGKCLIAALFLRAEKWKTTQISFNWRMDE